MIINIYGLMRSDLEQIFYIGSTKLKLSERLRIHLYPPRLGGYPIKKAIVDECRANGGTITIVLLDTCTPEQASDMETLYIKKYREMGAPLINATNHGGGGRRIIELTEQQKEIIAQHPAKSLRTLAQESGISRETIRRIIKDGGKNPYYEPKSKNYIPSTRNI